MTPTRTARVTVTPLDPQTAALVRLSARITAGEEDDVRLGFAECNAAKVSASWQEELVLQSYLFAGFPRALNAAREWRKAQGARAGDGSPAGNRGPVPAAGDGAREVKGAAAFTIATENAGEGYADLYDWRTRGEATCEVVYGAFYEKLRGNIRALHPALDEWMIVEGYGKVLSRSGLDLGRRELCIVAACAAARQDRQLHSHLHGALNAGVAGDAVWGVLEALEGVVDESGLERARLLFARVIGK